MISSNARGWSGTDAGLGQQFDDRMDRRRDLVVVGRGDVCRVVEWRTFRCTWTLPFVVVSASSSTARREAVAMGLVTTGSVGADAARGFRAI